MADRPPAPITIVPVTEVLTGLNILHDNWTLLTPGGQFINNLLVFQWHAEHRLIANERFCIACNRPYNFAVRNECQEGYHLRCGQCRATLSVRHDSFFAQGHLPLLKMICLLYCWCMDRITRIMYLNNLLQRYVFYIMCDNLK